MLLCLAVLARPEFARGNEAHFFALTLRATHDAIGPANQLHVIERALVIGENDLSDADSTAFRASGLSHLLAVSGTHLVFAVLGIVPRAGMLTLRQDGWAKVALGYTSIEEVLRVVA